MGHSCQNPEELQAFTENFKLHSFYPIKKCLSLLLQLHSLSHTSIKQHNKKD